VFICTVEGLIDSVGMSRSLLISIADHSYQERKTALADCACS